MPRSWMLAALLAALAVTGGARACSVPVFRYALERWPASAYEVLLFHKGPLPAEERAVLRPLEEAPTNCALTLVDIAGELAPSMGKVWEGQSAAAVLPWLVVRPPEAAEEPPVWAGPLSAANVAALLDSPARQRLAAHLGRGVSAVFVLLASGDAAADGAAEALLAGELKHLDKTTVLPERVDDGVTLRSPLPLRVEFAALRVARDDPAEALLVRTLLRCDEGLAAVRGPVVVPVFGRGRALCGLYGDELTADALGRVAAFLCGACSCQVKELNPGADLLLTADWDELLGAAPAPEASTANVPARPAIPTGLPPPPAAEPGGHRTWLWLATLAAAALAAVTGARLRSAPR